MTFCNTESPPFCDPFITSFCDHSGDTPYERKHGLLSQWVGYGKEEAYAIVFDTQKLWDVLRHDIDYFAYSAGTLKKATYDTDVLDFDAIYEPLIDSFARKVFLLIANTPETFGMGDIYQNFVIATACFKHQAFKDEREVRLFSAPHTQAMAEHLQKTIPQNYKPFDRELKTIYPRDKVGPKRIVLLDQEKAPRLPIKRIIIGPHPNQTGLAKKTKELVGGDVNVTLSETPYLPSKDWGPGVRL